MGRNFDRKMSVKADGRGGRQSFIQHDDRERTWNGDNRRVSFKDKRGGYSSKNRGDGGRDQSGKARPPRQRDFHFKNRRGRRGNAYILPSRLDGTMGSGPVRHRQWSKVVFLNAATKDKTAFLKDVMDHCHNKVKPLFYNKMGPHLGFYIETRDEATVLREAAKALGPSVEMRLENAPPPNATLTQVSIEKIQEVMSSRYSTGTKALDLKHFHADSQFLGQPIYAPLSRHNVLSIIVKTVEQYIPEVEALDFSNNRIATLDNFINLVKKAPGVKILHLSNNSIREIDELEKCRGWSLVNLKLDGNPFVYKFRDNTTYISAIRKIFPSLTILDGADLPRLITFDDDDVNTPANVNIPASIPKMLCNDQAGSVVLQFLEQYIKVYDSDDRKGLMDAYHENAMMSLSAAYPPDGHKGPLTKLDDYLLDSRNLFRNRDQARRMKALHQGKFAIVSFLNSLPKTLHHPDTITLDVPFATERLMTFTVTGLFKQREKKGEPVRHFNRMFVVVPQGTGFVIINDVLFITNPPKEKMNISFPKIPDNSTKQFQIEQISQKTGMNLEWSSKCLEQTNWDVGRALSAFETAKSEGKVPSEAFIR